MAHTGVPNEGFVIQIWWVVTTLFNTQQWTAKRRWSPTMGFDEQLTAFNQRNHHVTKWCMSQQPSTYSL